MQMTEQQIPGAGFVAVAFPDNGNGGHGLLVPREDDGAEKGAHCLCLAEGASDVRKKGCLEIHPCAFLARLVYFSGAAINQARSPSTWQRSVPAKTRDVATRLGDHVAL